MSLYLTTISKVRLLLALYIGAKKTFVRTKFDVKNASSYIYIFLIYFFKSPRRLSESSRICRQNFCKLTAVSVFYLP